MENKYNNIYYKQNDYTHFKNYEKVDNKYAKRLSFIDKIRVKPNSDRKLLIDLQNDYESGFISKENMTHEQVKDIEQMYIQQITQLNSKYIEKDNIKNIKRNETNNT